VAEAKPPPGFRLRFAKDVHSEEQPGILTHNRLYPLVHAAEDRCVGRDSILEQGLRPRLGPSARAVDPLRWTWRLLTGKTIAYDSARHSLRV
jgi:hypothetical protein